MNGNLMEKTRHFLANNWWNILTLIVVGLVTVYNRVQQIDIMTDRLARLEVVVEKVAVQFQDHLINAAGKAKSIESNDTRIDRLEKRIERLENYIQLHQNKP
jgi:hypothetical protein